MICIVTFHVKYDLVVGWAKFILIFFIKVHNLPTHEDQITFNNQNNINSITFCKICSHIYNTISNTPIRDSTAVETSELISNLD